VLVISNEYKEIKVVTPVYVGSTHDFSMFKNEKLIEAIPRQTPVYVDTGFEGIASLKEGLNFRKPKKKPRSKQLNGGERLGNRLISKERIKVEHAIGGMKRFRIVSEIFRGITHSMDMTIKIACGLWNLRIRRRSACLGPQALQS